MGWHLADDLALVAVCLVAAPIAAGVALGFVIASALELRDLRRKERT